MFLSYIFVVEKRLMFIKMNGLYRASSQDASPSSIVSNMSTSSGQSIGSAFHQSSRQSTSFIKATDHLNDNVGIAAAVGSSSSSLSYNKMLQPVLSDDNLFAVSITHEIAGSIDAPRNSSFGKLDIFNFKGALLDTEVEDAIAASNSQRFAQYVGGIDIVFKQSVSNNTVLTTLLCPCRVSQEGINEEVVIVCIVLDKRMAYAITAKFSSHNVFKQLNNRSRASIHNEFTRNNPLSLTHDFSEEDLRSFATALKGLLKIVLPIDLLRGIYVSYFNHE